MYEAWVEQTRFGEQFRLNSLPYLSKCTPPNGKVERASIIQLSHYLTIKASEQNNIQRLRKHAHCNSQDIQRYFDSLVDGQ